MHRITLSGTDSVITCADDDVILRAGLRAGMGLSYECNVGSCGMCKFELLDGEVEVLRTDTPGLSERDRKKGRMLACQCRPKADCTIKIRQESHCVPQALPSRQVVRLLETVDITHDIREFRFRAGRPAAFRAGQYAMLTVPGLGQERAYSLSNLPNEDGWWCFQIRKVPGGAGTSVLFDQLKQGDAVMLDGAYGLAYLREDVQRDVVCLAGGSGLAPMLSIARGWSALAKAPARRLDFFYGGRVPRDICGESMLRTLPEFGRSLQFHGVVSTPDAAQAEQWPGHVGYVHEVMSAVLGDALREREVYLAGPPPMVQASLEMLQGPYGVPPERIHFDRFF